MKPFTLAFFDQSQVPIVRETFAAINQPKHLPAKKEHHKWPFNVFALSHWKAIMRSKIDSHGQCKLLDSQIPESDIDR
jgi:hypothetical protein